MISDPGLLQQCTLEYTDKIFHPIKFGHMNGRHTEGTMVFDPDEMPGNFSIVVRGIPDENLWVYEW